MLKNAAKKSHIIEEEFEESVPIADSNEANLWFEKYRPTNIKDIVIDNEKLQQIKDWFLEFERHTVVKKALLFTGPPGLGKTSLAHVLLNLFGYQIKEFNASDIRSQSLVNKALFDIMCITQVNNEQPISIIMDEVDGMLTGDRGGIEELLSFIEPNNGRKSRKKKASVSATNNKMDRTAVWGPPVILICNTGNMKETVMNKLRKHCLEIKFNKPPVSEFFKLLQRICENEGIELDKETMDEIVNFSQQDYRRLLCLIQHLHARYGKHFNITNVQASYQIFCQKEQDMHVKESIKMILNKQLPYADVMKVFNRDRSGAPMVMHQNCIKAIESQRVSPIVRIENAIQALDSIVDSDIIEKTMFNTQGWHLQDIQGLSCCYVPSYYVNLHRKMPVTVSWTQVLGTNSHTQNSKKKAIEVALMIGKTGVNHSYSDIQFLSELVVELLLDKRNNEALDLLEQYGLLEAKIIDKLSSIVKSKSLSDQWKGKTASEKKVIDDLIVARSNNNVQIKQFTSYIPVVKRTLKPTPKSTIKDGVQAKPTAKAKLALKKLATTATASTEVSKPTLTLKAKSNPSRRLIAIKKNELQFSV